MKTILLIANKIPHYRVSVYNYLADHFRQQNWEFKVASDSRLREADQQLNFQFHEIRFGFFRYRNLIRKVNPDAVILHLHLKIPMFWPLLHWLKLKGIPVISWTKGANLDRPNSRVRYELFNYTHRLSDALLLYSSNELSRIKPAYRQRVFPANNTVNFEDYPELTTSKAEIKAELAIPFTKVVLFVGTMGIGGERKRVSHLIKIFNEMDRSDVGLILVGSGMNDATRSSINHKNTLVFGPVHDSRNITISKLFKAADLYVVPGHVGLGINQAFYWGLPVVTENCLQPPEIQYLKSGRNGFIVPDNDLEALRERMLYLLDNDGVRAEFSQNARADILREASIEGMFQGFLKAVEYVHSARNTITPAGRDVKAIA